MQRAEVQCQGGEVTEPCPSRYPIPGRAGTVCQHSGCGHPSQRLPPARGVTLPENAYEVPLRLTPSQRQADARTRKARPVPQWGIRSWCFSSWELLPLSCLHPRGPSGLSREPAPPPQPAPVNHLTRIPSSGSASKVPA